MKKRTGTYALSSSNSKRVRKWTRCLTFTGAIARSLKTELPNLQIIKMAAYLLNLHWRNTCLDAQPDEYCEDIHLGGSQQCHEPVGNSSSTKSTQGHSTRPICKVTFSQSGPTMIRPDLHNFSAWLRRPPRPEDLQWPLLHILTACRPLLAGWKPEPFSSHILTGLESNFPNQPQDHTFTTFTCISRGSKINQTSKISWAVQLTSLLRFRSINLILDPTSVLD